MTPPPPDDWTLHYGSDRVTAWRLPDGTLVYRDNPPSERPPGRCRRWLANVLTTIADVADALADQLDG